jgi:hypothetical protein
MPALAKQKISKELAMGRIAGPFSVRNNLAFKI